MEWLYKERGELISQFEKRKGGKTLDRKGRWMWGERKSFCVKSVRESRGKKEEKDSWGKNKFYHSILLVTSR